MLFAVAHFHGRGVLSQCSSRSHAIAELPPSHFPVRDRGHLVPDLAYRPTNASPCLRFFAAAFHWSPAGRPSVRRTPDQVESSARMTMVERDLLGCPCVVRVGAGIKPAPARPAQRHHANSIPQRAWRPFPAGALGIWLLPDLHLDRLRHRYRSASMAWASRRSNDARYWNSRGRAAMGRLPSSPIRLLCHGQ